MEITCKRCHTEYEFDDALASERGTTVRCTNCGELFKVYRPASSGVPDQWVVRCRDGRQLTFTSLRDLQRAISNLQVGRHDELIRGSAPARPLGSIAELEPFFLGRLGQAAGGGRARAQTPQGLAPTSPQRAGLQPLTTTQPEPAPVSDVDPLGKTAGPGAVPPRTGRTGRPPPMGPGMPPPATPHPDAVVMQRTPKISYEDEPRRPAAEPLVRSKGTLPGPGTPMRPPAQASPPPRRAEDDGIPNDARISRYPDDDFLEEPRFSAALPTRSRALRWLVLLIVLGLLGMAAAIFGRRYAGELRRMVAGGAPSAAAVDGRTGPILDEGERALADGDLESAKESFDKASVLSERDPRALVDLARLAAVRADQDWLKVRLLGVDPPLLASAKRQLAESTQRAMKAVDRAAAVAPDEPLLARTRLDVLRIAGDRARARTLVPTLASVAAQPDTAYVLAALDLEEGAPSWPAILDRLRSAAAAEGSLMRARSVLVYALVRAGNAADAKAELEKIIGSPRSVPLLAELRAFVGKSVAPIIDAGTSEADAGKKVETKEPVAGSRAAEENASAAGGGGGGDFRALLAQAAQAQSARDYARAEDLYRSALANGGDTEALAGLGDCARARGNSAQARSYYERVLGKNPQYLPTIAALADIKWESGDRAGAVVLYREVLESSPSGSLGSRARERIAQAEAPKAAPPPSPAPRGPGAGSEVPSGVDTSDLPGFKR